MLCSMRRDQMNIRRLISDSAAYEIIGTALGVVVFCMLIVDYVIDERRRG